MSNGNPPMRFKEVTLTFDNYMADIDDSRLSGVEEGRNGILNLLKQFIAISETNEIDYLHPEGKGRNLLKARSKDKELFDLIDRILK